MGLEQDIQQESFKSEYHKLVVNIAYTQSFLNGKLNKFLKPYDLSMQQFNVLRILRGQHPEPVSINSITERMIDKMSNASRLVEKLRKKEMVERSVCKEDRRQADIKITDTGLQALAELDESLDKYDLIFSHVPESYVKFANEVLDRLREENKD